MTKPPTAETKIQEFIRTLSRETENKLRNPSLADYFPSTPAIKEITWKERLKEEQIEEKRLTNTDHRQDIQLKKYTLLILLFFLGLETVAVYVYSYFQATYHYGFRLEEWSFKLLVSVTLLQVTYMLTVAIHYLFPNKSNSR